MYANNAPKLTKLTTPYLDPSQSTFECLQKHITDAGLDRGHIIPPCYVMVQVVCTGTLKDGRVIVCVSGGSQVPTVVTFDHELGEADYLGGSNPTT